MISLVTLEAAKLHLHVLNSDHDADIAAKIAQASEIVMNHYKHYTVPTEWIIGTSPVTYDIPQWAQAATLLETAELFYNREGSVSGILSDAVKSLIPRDPTLA